MAVFCLSIYISRIEKRRPEIKAVRTKLGRIQRTIMALLMFGMLMAILFEFYEAWSSPQR